MRNFLKIVVLAIISLCAGYSWADEQGDVYKELYQALDQNSAAPEKANCVNRMPFAEGYDCDKRGTPSFRLATLNVSLVQSNSKGRITNMLIFDEHDHCLDYRKLEAYLPKRKSNTASKRTLGDGRSIDEIGIYYLHGAAISITRLFDADTVCMTNIWIEKRVK